MHHTKTKTSYHYGGHDMNKTFNIFRTVAFPQHITEEVLSIGTNVLHPSIPLICVHQYKADNMAALAEM
jgi:hypothetical protein